MVPTDGGMKVPLKWFQKMLGNKSAKLTQDGGIAAKKEDSIENGQNRDIEEKRIKMFFDRQRQWGG